MSWIGDSTKSADASAAITRMSGFGLVSMTQTSKLPSTDAEEAAQVPRERRVLRRLALQAHQRRSLAGTSTNGSAATRAPGVVSSDRR